MTADLCAVYGAGVLALPYPQQVGLYMNIPRIRATWALAVKRGTAAAASDGPLSPVWADAAVEDADQVRLLHRRTNLMRAVARAKRIRKVQGVE